MEKEHIGILSLGYAPRKSEILFFDKFISMQPETWSGKEPDKDYQYLQSIGLIEQKNLSLEQVYQGEFSKDDSFNEMNAYAQRLIELTSSVNERGDSLTLTSRYFALKKNLENKNIYTPINPSLANLKSKQTSSVIDVVINNMPSPNEDIPYEELLDFKNDSRVLNNRKSFNRWIRNKLGSNDLSIQELNEEIADLTSDYREYMELAKMKYDFKVKHISLNIPLGTIEKIMKLQFSKLTQPFYELKLSQIEYFEAELKAPGKELAYFTDIDKRLK
ncbi:hypothetical protein NB461_09705 [Vibrio alginolyticus]|uniref:hypothetical protein n=2 Tax=Vibrio alginolyticus TaxID=663 RepID=UPI00215BFF22|nr:hypothetical protein [Vibrio alginolyticus]EGQ8156519.1 hypothetical protein [Vibrio alginolyticus]ELB2796539.1 hypothetical protein [Vibrio alginolyticus]MCR9599008.1 hypothetical protein [Vibrio alginolyticus]MCR9604399.1 hypothetical protein [Vibrio alginolyticus]HBK5922022.1 hypothetical protein [Vibrio alginolyticus]